MSPVMGNIKERTSVDVEILGLYVDKLHVGLFYL